MPDSCSIAFKEWAAVCEALAAGRQTIILRKGGIQEGREGFRVQHGEFCSGSIPPTFIKLLTACRLIAANSLPAPWPGPNLVPESCPRFRFASLPKLRTCIRSQRKTQCCASTANTSGPKRRSARGLPREIPTAGLTPVMSDAAFAGALAQVRAAVA
jgi:hypothetical protein